MIRQSKTATGRKSTKIKNPDNRKKQTRDLDFSPRNHIPCKLVYKNDNENRDKLKKDVKKIALKYERIQDDFILERLDVVASSFMNGNYENLMREFPRKSQKKSYYKSLQAAFNQFKDACIEVEILLKKASFAMLGEMHSEHTEIMKQKKSTVEFKVIKNNSQTISYLPDFVMGVESCCSDLKDALNVGDNIVTNIINRITPDSGGKAKGSLQITMIGNLIVHLYEKLRQRKSYIDSIKEEPIGGLHYFLLDIDKIFKKSQFKFSLGTPFTIEKYTRKVIAEIKRNSSNKEPA